MATIIRGPYLQMATSTTNLIRWYTNVATDTKVWWGTSLQFTNTFVSSTSVTNHEARISGLQPNTKYFYGVGSTSQCISSGSTNYFYTAPASSSSAHTRVWVTADFGWNSANQKGVKDKFITYNSTALPNNRVDLFFMVGDNAYGGGSNTDYDNDLFLGANAYGTELKKFNSFLVPGNHDYNNVGYNSGSATGLSWPIFERFNQPANSECGGVVSRIEKYFSVNWGNAHFIVLDGYGTPSGPTSAMYKWLENDLKFNRKKWTVVFQHFSPFSHGTHNSDTDTEMVNMRLNIVPLLYRYNVDLMIGGHSHVYERSYFMKNFTGTAAAWNSTYISQSGLGNNTGGNLPYDKSLSQSGTTFIVIGNGGQPGTGSVSTSGTWPHSAMITYNKATFASLIIDVNTDITATLSNGNYMSVKALGISGSLLDRFLIKK